MTSSSLEEVDLAPAPESRSTKEAVRKFSDGRGYIRGLDGLRALAALGVIAYHLEIPGSTLGWSGVYLFYVLSGFLVTRILVDAKGKDHYFTGFYLRRALRIFPIYYLVLAIVTGGAVISGWAVADWPWFATYLQNWILGLEQFHVEFPAMLEHTWTLATEEQFYLLWPLAVFFCSRNMLKIAIAGLIGVGLLSRTASIVIGHNEFAVFALTPCSADFLAWGAAATYAMNSLPRQWLAKWALAAFLVLLVLLLAGSSIAGVQQGWTPQDSLLSVPVGVFLMGLQGPLFAALLLFVYADDGFVARLLEWPPLRYLGRMSYGLYLYHWPILNCFKLAVGNDGPAILRSQITESVIVVTLTIVVSFVSFEFIERRFLALKRIIA